MRHIKKITIIIISFALIFSAFAFSACLNLNPGAAEPCPTIELLRRIEELEYKLARQGQDIAELAKENQAVRDKIAELSKTIEMLETLNKQQSENIEALEKKLFELRNRVRELEMEIACMTTGNLIDFMCEDLFLQIQTYINPARHLLVAYFGTFNGMSAVLFFRKATLGGIPPRYETIAGFNFLMFTNAHLSIWNENRISMLYFFELSVEDIGVIYGRYNRFRAYNSHLSIFSR